jgi:molybdate transport system regulatory protein
MYGMEAGFEARLQNQGVTFETRDATLLQAVERENSLNAAAASLGRSYSRCHERLTDLEDAFGPLVERTRGGKGGGGSHVTDRAQTLLARFSRLRAEFSGVVRSAETVFHGEILSRQGALATVDTDVGPIRVLLFEDADVVQVALRADAVTLHEPRAAPSAAGTSARNHLEGTISAIDVGESIACIEIDIGDADPLIALVTSESLRRLDLEPGATVVATFKATATRATGK